jgi:hypothetical protein
VRIEYRSSNGEPVDTTLDRVVLDELGAVFRCASSAGIEAASTT